MEVTFACRLSSIPSPFPSPLLGHAFSTLEDMPSLSLSINGVNDEDQQFAARSHIVTVSGAIIVRPVVEILKFPLLSATHVHITVPLASVTVAIDPL